MSNDEDDEDENDEDSEGGGKEEKVADLSRCYESKFQLKLQRIAPPDHGPTLTYRHHLGI